MEMLDYHTFSCFEWMLKSYSINQRISLETKNCCTIWHLSNKLDSKI